MTMDPRTVLYILLAVAKVKSYNYYISQAIAGFRDQISNIDRIAEVPTHSDIDCARRCILTIRCFSFFYNANTRSCQLHGRLLDTTNASLFFVESGNCFYRVKGRQLIGEACVSSSECAVPNSECREERVCGCIAGYSFHPSIHTCQHGCTQYGNTFQSFKNFAIRSLNEETIANKKVDECAQLCIDATAFACVTFDFEPAMDRCFLASVGALDRPLDYVPDTRYYYYQRNCA